MKKLVYTFIFSVLFSSFVWGQNVLKLTDSNTLETTDFVEVKTFEDGRPMTDNLCDGVIYIKNQGKYYKRVIQGPINIKWFGAKGDGNANDVGTDDTRSIVKALTTLENIYKAHRLTGGHYFGGFTLYFPKGIYIVSETLKLPHGITILGASRSETMIHMKSQKNIFTNVRGMLNKTDVDMSTNINIKHLTLKQGGLELQNSINSKIEDISIFNAGSSAMHIRIPVNLIVKNVLIVNADTGIKYEDNMGSGPSTTTTFENIWIQSCNKGIVMDGNTGDSHKILTTRILNSIIEYNNIGIELKGNIENLVVRDIHFEQNKTASMMVNDNVSFTLEDAWTDKGDIILKNNPKIDQSKVKIYFKNNNIPVNVDKNFKGKIVNL